MSSKVLLITQYFDPEPNFITKDLAVELSAKGAEVLVLTTFPNYPFGKFYESVNSIWPKFETKEYGSVWRLPIYPNHSSSILKRLFYYSSFLLVSFIWNVYLLIFYRPDVVIVYQTPFTTAYGALIFKLIKSKLVYICCDLWPESFSAVGITIPKKIYRLLYWMSAFINRFADKIIVSTNGMRKRFLADGIIPEKVVFLPIWVDGLPLNSNPSKDFDKSTIKIVYAGNIGPAQALDVLVDAADMLRKDKRFQFDIYGTGVEYESLKKKIEAKGVRNIRLYGRVPPETAFERLSSASFVVLHLKNSDYFNMTLPSKLSSLLASGAILLCGANGETREIIKENNAGLIFEPENAESLAVVINNAMTWSEADLKKIADGSAELYNKSFSPKTLVNKYTNLIFSTL